MNEKRNYRYPGLQVFDEEQQNVFLGREDDIRKLYQMIDLEQIVVLYSKSGYGKSSLIRAGLIPKIKEEKQYTPVYIHFRNFFYGKNVDLIQLFMQSIHGNNSINQEKKSYLDVFDLQESHLWKYFKQQQAQQQQSNFVFIFDQFEEFFSYPQAQIEQAKEELTELLFTNIPKTVRNILKDKPEILSNQEKNWLNTELKIKFLFVMRSDKISELDKLRDDLPDILANNYELKTLSRRQVANAITVPAAYKSKDANFLSKPFTFSAKAEERILDFLSKQDEQQIVPTLLQIVCNCIERKVIEKRIRTIELKHLDDLENLYGNFYDKVINQIDIDWRDNVRFFVEEILIDSENESKLAIFENHAIDIFKIDQNILHFLVSSHLLKSEEIKEKGIVYELGHDSLVVPILKSKAERTVQMQVRLAKEKAIREEKIKTEQHRKKQQTIIRKLSIAFFSSVLIFALSFLFVVNKKNNDLRAQNAKLNIAKNEISDAYSELVKIARDPRDTSQNFTLNKKILAIKIEIDQIGQNADSLERITLELNEILNTPNFSKSKVKALAQNYSNLVFNLSSNKLLQNIETGIAASTFRDNRTGEAYRTIIINGKEWFVQNYGRKAEGSWGYNDADSSRWFGRLYPYHVAVQEAPDGWRLPLIEDWDELLVFFNSNKKTTLLSDNWPKGFAIQYAGYRNKNSTYHQIRRTAMFWASGDTNEKQRRPYFSFLKDKELQSKHYYGDSIFGLSVRYVRDLK